MPLQYYDLLDKPDWYQPFNGNTNVETQLPYTLKTGVGRTQRQFVNDAPAGLGGQSMELIPSAQIECEYITSLSTAYPRVTGQTSQGATYEFWIKIPSGYTLTQGNYKLLFRERVSQGYTIWDRIVLTPDWRILVWGSNNGANGNGYLMSSGQIYSDPLSHDVWHHISIVYANDTVFSSSTALRGHANILLYVDGILTSTVEGNELAGCQQSATTGSIVSGTGGYSFGWDGAEGLVFSGETTNDGGFFAQFNSSGIPLKIAGFAMWFKTAQTSKQIARRYMFGIAASKNRQKYLIEQSNPWFACDLNNVSWDGTTETFQTQFGSNVTSNGPWATSLTTGLVNNLTLKNPDSLEGNGISQINVWTNATSGQIAFDSAKAAQLDAIHNSGNMSFEAWAKWGWVRNNFKPTKPGTGPLYNMISTLGGVAHVIRVASDGRIEFADRFGDSLLSMSTNSGPISQKVITDNDWVHLAATYTNNAGTVTIRGYINGRLAVTRNVTGNLLNPSWGTINQMTLMFAGNATQIEPKTMDIFALYDRPLSASEVRSRYLNYAAVDRDVKYYNGTDWKVPTANKYWNGSEWAFWDDKVKYWDGDSWELV